MPKRRTHDSSNRYDVDDNPIDLTGAFAPVKGPQSVDYAEEDDPVGLTQAFGAVSGDEERDTWEDAGKWKDFDWDAALGEPEGTRESEEARTADPVPIDSPEPAAPDGAGQGARKDGRENVGRDARYGVEGDVAILSRKDVETGSKEGLADPLSGMRTAASTEGSDASARAFVDESTPKREQSASSAQPKKSGPKHGRHAAPEPELSPRMRKSQRMRRVLVVLVALLVVVIVALVYFMYRTFSNSQQEAAQQAQEQVATPKNDIGDAPADDAVDTAAQLASVPDLTRLLGASRDQAVESLGRGALVTAYHEVNEEGNPIKANLNVALTDEVADTKTGTPTVYLGIGEDGTVRQAGYSASASALGFGSLSFADAVNNEHVVEKTFDKAGVEVAQGSAVLPSNKDEYSTYASDGTTVVRERCSFEGDADVGGVPCTWSAVLSYDYTTQVVTGNLSDTVRIIYVYITAK